MEHLEGRSRHEKAVEVPIGCGRWLVRGNSSVGFFGPIGQASLVEAEEGRCRVRTQEAVRYSSGAGYVEADDRRQFAGRTGVDEGKVLVGRERCGLWYLWQRLSVLSDLR